MNAALEPSLPLHRFTRVQYEQMIGAGVFGPEEHLELLDGELIDMAPQLSRHATAVTLVDLALKDLFGAGFTVRNQLPLNLDSRSVPEPDIAVVSGSPRDYRDAHPATALLVVEVSETTLGYDRIRKLAAYARAGIPEYWVLDLAHARLEVCRQPDAEVYAERRVLKADDTVAPLAAPGPGIKVADLLP